jgi:prophage regulatory protein
MITIRTCKPARRPTPASRAVTAARGRRVLRLDGVIEKTGLSRASIYRLQDAGEFPPSIRLSANRVGWFESEIDRWITERIVASAAGAPAAE